MAVGASGAAGDPFALLGALAFLVVGGLTLRGGVRRARRWGLFTATFWQTFRQYAPYRGKRLAGLVVSLAGLILTMWGALSLLGWIRAYYAARLGHPAP